MPPNAAETTWWWCAAGMLRNAAVAAAAEGCVRAWWGIVSLCVGGWGGWVGGWGSSYCKTHYDLPHFLKLFCINLNIV